MMGRISSRAGTVALSGAVLAGPLAVPLSGITDACPNLPPQQPADHRVQIRSQIRMACVRGCGICAHHKKATVRKRLKVPAHKCTELPLHAVPGDRRANRPAYHESDPGRFSPVQLVIANQKVAYHAGPARSGPGAHGQGELRAAAHPGLGWKDQALSRSRPLRLRAARTARPARVRMRSRKPCVFARRRLFGWNVRLLTGTPGKGSDEGTRDYRVRYRNQHRLPPGTPLFGRRAPLPRLRLWKAILPRLRQSRCAAGKPRAQHVDSSVDRERGSRRGCEGSATDGKSGPGRSLGTIPGRAG